VQGRDLPQLSLNLAQISEDHRDRVEGKHDRSQIKLQNRGFPIRANGSGKSQWTVIVDGVPASDESYHQRGKSRPAQIDLDRHQHQEGKHEKQQRRAALTKDHQRDGHYEYRINPAFAQQMRIPHSALQDGGDGGRDDGDPQSVREGPVEQNAEKVLMLEDMFVYPESNAGNRGTEQAGESNEAEQVPVICKYR
jgi:hypothetical protein